MPPIPKKQSPRPQTTSLTKSGSKAATGSVLERIAPIGFDSDEGIKLALYGRSATGKTTLWSTFPGPILAAICSGGLRPGEAKSIDTPENRKKIKSVVLNSGDEFQTLCDHIAETAAYNTFVLDHCSGLQDLVLSQILGLETLPAQKSWGMATQQQYGQCTLQVKTLLRSMLNLSCNCVVVAQERNFNEEASDDMILPAVGPGLTPSLTSWLNPAVDYIGNTFIRAKFTVSKIPGTDVPMKELTGGYEYCLRTGPHAVYTTKFRVPRGGKPLPEVLVDPSYEKIMKLIRGG